MADIRDLSSTTGLPLGLTAAGEITFGPGLDPIVPGVRKLRDVRDVLMNPDADGPDELYTMYRNVALAEHRERLAAARLRYDVTVIRPGTIGREYVKTAGHYHPLAPASTVTYPEIYEVAAGQALFLLQRAEPPYTAVTDVVAVEAGPGERLLVPPGYGHITINIGSDWLVLTNLVEATFGSVYEPVQAMQGGAYYVVAAGGAGEGAEFVANPRYADNAPLRQRRSAEWPELGIAAGKPLYRDAAEQPERFRYLVEPGQLPADLI